MIDDKLPPQNVEAETLILGGILFDPRALGRIADFLPAEAFYIKAHQKIYSAALALYHQDKPTDLMTVSNWLEDHKQLEKVGGVSQLASLIERTVSAANIDRYARVLTLRQNTQTIILQYLCQTKAIVKKTVQNDS